jgi:hypothetical protein
MIGSSMNDDFGKDVEGSSKDLIWGTILAYVWRDCGKSRNTQDSILIETQTEHVCNTSQNVTAQAV